MKSQEKSKTFSEDKSEFTSWRIFDKRKTSIESDISKGFLDNRGYLLVIGGFYLSFPGHWILPTIFLLNFAFHIYCLLMTAYISWGDIGEMGETLHYSAFIITTTSELTNGLLHRSQMEYMMRSLGHGVYDYGETLDEDTAAEIKKICSDAKRNKNFHSKIFTAMVLLALCFIILSKTVTTAFIGTNDDETNNKDEDFNGIIRYTPVPCWYPFDARDSAYMYYILQYAAGYAAALSVLATDVIYICLSEEIAAQLKIVGITLRNAVQRAKKFMVSTGEKNIKKSLSRCLSCSVEHHIVSLRLVEALGNYYYYLLLCLMFGGALVLCLAGFVFCTKSVSITTKITFFVTLAGELAHVLIFCWYGEKMKKMSLEIGDQIYESDWIKYSSEMKNFVLMVTGRSLKPKTLSAGGFSDLSMVTFSNVLSSAYSYFNLLNASQ